MKIKEIIISVFFFSFIVDATVNDKFPFEKIKYVEFEIKVGFMGPFQDTSGREPCEKNDKKINDFGTGGFYLTYMDYDTCFWYKLLSESFAD